MKAKTIPAKFNFSIKAVKISKDSTQEFRLCLRRKGKAVCSKIYRRTGQITPINENMEFPTTLEQNDKGSYDSKKVTLELQLKDAIESDMQTVSAEMELTFFLENKQFNILLGIEQTTAEVKLEGSVETEGFNPVRCGSVIEPPEWPKSNDVIADKENTNPIRKRDSAKSPFGINKKTKTWLKKNDDDTKSMDGRKIATTSNLKARSEYTIQQPVEIKATSQAPKWEKCSIDTDRQLKLKKRVMFHEENNVSHEIQNNQDQKSPSIHDNRSTRSIEADIIENEVFELRRSNKLLKKQMDELKGRLSQCQIKERATSTLEQSVITRLKEEVTLKNKAINLLEQKIESLERSNREMSHDITTYQRQVTELKTAKDILKDRASLTNTQKQNGGVKQQIDKIKKIHQEQVIELKKKLSQVKKQLIFKDIHTASVPVDSLHNDVCLSKECDSERKDFKNQIKSLKKSLEDTEAKLKTKQKLLQTYNNLQADRQKQNSRVKQQEKWRAEKILLEQQNSELKQRIQQVSHLQSQGTKLKSELYVRRSEKQSLQKELQKFKKVLYQSGQEQDQLNKQLKQQVLKSKQQIMHLLNAVQEYGGRILYDKVSAALLE